MEDALPAPDQYAVWNAIGASFDETRPRPWPVVEAWLAKHAATRPGARLLDLMSGNGRHGVAAEAHGYRPVALDWSAPLVQAAAPRLPVVQADAARLPFADHAFDAAVYIAGLHGIPDAAARQASLAELHRVLRPGAPAIITTWSRNAPRFETLEPDVADVIVPWNREGRSVPRTYHLYTPQTLRDACRAAGFEVIRCEDVAISAPAPDNVLAELLA